MSIYDYKVKTKSGKEISLDKYKNKVMLIVNTSITCGFTPQYEQLESLYEKYKDKGLVILDFPCNQFSEDEIKDIHEIADFCKYKYNIKFEQFDKIEVNGESALPLYTYLKSQMPEDTIKGFRNKIIMNELKKESKSYQKQGDIIWNFTKFLVNREGSVVSRFSPTYTPNKIEDYIRNILEN